MSLEKKLSTTNYSYRSTTTQEGLEKVYGLQMHYEKANENTLSAKSYAKYYHYVNGTTLMASTTTKTYEQNGNDFLESYTVYDYKHVNALIGDNTNQLYRLKISNDL